MGVKGYAIHLSFSPGNGVLMRDNTPKSTRTQGGDPIADYIRADTRLPAYLPYPRFLLKMEISQTAKLLYSLLLDRSTLSQKNKWLDDEGRIYIIYPIAEIAEILDKGSTTIKGALNELDTAGLLERERGGFSAPNRLYVKVPPVPQVQFSDQLMAGSPPLIEPENRPTDGQKTDLTKGEKRISHSNPADCYECSTYNLAYQKYDRHCTCHHISTKALKSIILKTIQETCHYVSLNEQEFVYSLQEESAMKDIAISETVKNRIERNQKRVHELDMLIRKIYEDNVIGRLPDRLFQSMLTDYENEQNELNKIIETDTADMQRIIGGQNNVERFLKLVKKYENITELTPAMINEFIDKILVHEPQGKGADRTTEVEIYLNYVGQFQVPVEQHEPTEEERIAAEKEAERLRRKRESNRKYMKKIREKSKEFAEHERIPEEKSSDSNVCFEQNATSKSNRQKVKGEKIA